MLQLVTVAQMFWAIISELSIWQHITSELNFTTFNSKHQQWGFPHQARM